MAIAKSKYACVHILCTNRRDVVKPSVDPESDCISGTQSKRNRVSSGLCSLSVCTGTGFGLATIRMSWIFRKYGALHFSEIFRTMHYFLDGSLRDILNFKPQGRCVLTLQKQLLVDLFLLFAFLQDISTFLEVLHHNSNQHVENDKTRQQEKSNKIQHVPFLVVTLWLLVKQGNVIMTYRLCMFTNRLFFYFLYTHFYKNVQF